MSELVARYVHQVGRHLPKNERAEIEAELRSTIQDQLEDRFGPAPSDAEIALVLREMGDPSEMAASYKSHQYLIGPGFYPSLMMVLRRGWLLIPAVVALINVAESLASSSGETVIGLLIETFFVALQAILIFSAIVVLVFVILERSSTENTRRKNSFDPLTLPPVDDPANIDRVELAFGLALGTFVGLLFLYFSSVGGLTFSFNLRDPGEVLPVSVPVMLLLAALMFVQVGIHFVVLWRNRWTFPTILVEFITEVVSVICLYAVVFQPLAVRVLETAPQLANIPGASASAEVTAVILMVITIWGNGSKLLRLWNYRNRTLSATPSAR